MLRKIALIFSAIILFYVLMLRSSSIHAFTLFYLLFGLLSLLAVFNIAHDAAHGVAVKGKFWNKLLFKLTFNLLGNNAFSWGKNHLSSHHLYTNIDGSDIDVHSNPLVRIDAQQPLKAFHRYQFLYSPFLVLLYSLNWLLIRDFSMLLNMTNRCFEIELSRKEQMKLFAGKLIYLFYMLVVPIHFSELGVSTVLLVFLCNHFLISLVFYCILSVGHVNDIVAHPIRNESGKIEMSWPLLQMSTTLDFNTSSKLCSWFLGGFNTHAIHHLLPNICHVHYVDLVALFTAVAKKHRIQYHTGSYSSAIVAHFKYLYRMGRTISYD